MVTGSLLPPTHFSTWSFHPSLVVHQSEWVSGMNWLYLVPLRSRQCGVDGLVPAGRSGAVGRSHWETVEDRASIGPPGWVEIRVLVEARRVARVRVVIVGALEVSIVTLRTGERGCGRGRWSGRGDTGLATIWAIIWTWGWAVGVLAVVAGAQLLCFNVEPVLAHVAGRGRCRGHGALAAPRWPVGTCVAVWGSVRAAGSWSLPVAVVWGQGGGAWGVAVEREVLVKLMHVEGLHVADDISAELRDVYVAEVDVLSAAVNKTTAFMLKILLHPVVQVCFGSSGWGRRTVGLPWKEKKS